MKSFSSRGEDDATGGGGAAGKGAAAGGGSAAERAAGERAAGGAGASAAAGGGAATATRPAGGAPSGAGAPAGMDFAALARACLERTEALVGRHGPRLAGSEPAKAAARELAEELRGFCDSVRAEEFEAHPASFYAYMKVLPAAYLLGLLSILAFRGLYLAPLLGLVSGIALMASQFGLYGRLGDRLFPRRTCLNVEGVVEPAGEAEFELIVSGHHDSAPVARIYSGPFQRWYAFAIFAPYPFFLLQAGLLASLIARPGSAPPAWAPAVLLSGLPFAVAYFLLVDTRRGSPGAGDNLVSSVLAATIARELAARKGELLRRTRLRAASFDAEEAGLRGSAAYMRARRGERGGLPVFMLNFDSLYSASELHVLVSDVNGTVRLSRGMAEDAADCLRAEGHDPRLYPMAFGGGATDAAEAARAGVQATTVIAMPTAVVREGLVYHTPRDRVEAIEPGVVEACLRLVARYVALLESGKARVLDDRAAGVRAPAVVIETELGKKIQKDLEKAQSALLIDRM